MSSTWDYIHSFHFTFESGYIIHVVIQISSV